MNQRRLPISEFFSASRANLLLDVRSPAEYSHAHMPGAVNIPLFDNEERKVVGTAYKQESRELAIKIGLDYFGPKMRKIVEEVEALLKERAGHIGTDEEGSGRPNGEIFLYCWRGGMRSAAVAWLLGIYGYSVVLLAGGYKAYRNHVLELLAHPYSLRVIGGFTGSGKTEVLHALKEGGAGVIDLEGLAGHKGSAFGNIGLPPQPKQEMFENRLALELFAAGDAPLWIEDESQRIGLVNIPPTFWNTLRSAPVFFLDIPFEERLEHITEEYGQCEKEALSDAILRIAKRLGPLETKNAFQHLQEDNFKECFRILLRYYDKHYLKGLHKREAIASLLTSFPCTTVTPANAGLLLNPQTV